jgi:uncharacterized protein YecE (DUF72 family)
MHHPVVSPGTPIVTRELAVVARPRRESVVNPVVTREAGRGPDLGSARESGGTRAALTGRLHVGTSGFAYEAWRNGFYPEGLSPRRMLRHYASVLRSVEINYTFRRLPSEAVIARWRHETPDGFRFTLKAHQRITHFKRLEGTADDVAELVLATAGLGDRLGAILFQLPPTLQYEPERLERFLGELPAGPRFAMEFRHESWSAPQVREALAAHGVALCGAETDAAALAEIPVTAEHVYLRLRRTSYTARALAAWARRIRPLLGEGHDVFCFFKHEDGGLGPAYAQALCKRLAP